MDAGKKIIRGLEKAIVYAQCAHNRAVTVEGSRKYCPDCNCFWTEFATPHREGE